LESSISPPEFGMSPLLHNLSPDGDEAANATTIHRRIEITVEREVVSVEYLPAANVTGWCQQCGKNVLMLTAEAAALAHGTSPREIYRRLDDNKLHFHESPSGTVFICSESLNLAPNKELP
jgi:hypothetical protein